MSGARGRIFLAGPLFFFLWPPDVRAQDAAWQSHMETATGAHRRGSAAGAERLLRAALELAEGFAEHDRRRGETHMALATVLFEQNEFAEARAHLEQAVTIFEAGLGPEHPLVATALNALALAYVREGDYEHAEPLYRRALAIFEASFGPDHGDVGRVVENLAGLLLADGRYDDAGPLYRRAISIKGREFGPRHPEVAKLLESYAIVLHMTGRDAEADALEARASAILSERGDGAPAN